LSKNFFSIWSGPIRVTANISDLNYQILWQNGRKFVVYLNRLKRAMPARITVPLRHVNSPEGRDRSETWSLGQIRKPICIRQPSSLIHNVVKSKRIVSSN
jgi:hypothetical protein